MRRFLLFFPLIATLLTLTNCQLPNPLRMTASDTLIVDKSGYLYDPNDRSCDGFPRLKVQTMPGTCLGLVVPQTQSMAAKMIMPRTIVPIPNSSDFLIADMGHWKAADGSIFLLKKNQNQYILKRLKYPIENPHGLEFGPDGLLYVGEKQRIVRYKYTNESLSNEEIIIDNFSKILDHSHPLTQFTFDPTNGDLFINLGSETDHCRAADGSYKMCEEEWERSVASIIRIPGHVVKNPPAGGAYAYQIVAHGLRNSMAMAIHSSGTLVQGENGRDFKEFEEPYEEINVIEAGERGLHYGWPYCYNFSATSPEWLFPENAKLPKAQQVRKPIDCNAPTQSPYVTYRPPYALMPPHVAPLHARYYHGKMFASELEGKLLMTWHGHAPTGHRLVAYNVDEKGRPVISTNITEAKYSFDQERGCASTVSFKPRGGMNTFAAYEEIISQWNEIPGVRQKGTPVAFAVAQDGSIWITEDKTKQVIVRLAKDNSALPAEDCTKTDAASDDPNIKYLVWRNLMATNPALDIGYKKVKSEIIEKHCSSCHESFLQDPIAKDNYSTLDYLVKKKWFLPRDSANSKMYSAISQNGIYKPMPPKDEPQFFGTAHGSELIQILGDWIQSLPASIEQYAQKITLASPRKIRSKPAADGLACGQFEGGDTIYVDPRAETRANSDGWLWSKVYVIPGSTRLFSKGCAYPTDGVFYVAIRKL